MAITPPSDIVLDVARAADPERYRLAAERLARSRAAQPSPATAETLGTNLPNTSASTAAARTVTAGGNAQPRRQLDAYGQFEAFLLQSFIQSMLPKNAASVFGKGSAGEFWKSMLAEKMGGELARSGQVGIAQRLAAGPSHPLRPDGVNTAGPAIPPPPLRNTLINWQPQRTEAALAVDPPASAPSAANERS